MKKTIFLISMGLIFLTSCKKKDRYCTCKVQVAEKGNVRYEIIYAEKINGTNRQTKNYCRDRDRITTTQNSPDVDVIYRECKLQ